MSEKLLPLEGIRVIEMGTHVAVPSGMRLLADFGAEIIKVEKPTGDPYRAFGDQYSTPIEEDYNPFFTFHNTNKKLIELDLKSKEGRELLLRLLETADVLATNIRLGSLKKLGLDYDALKARFPHLIYCHFSGLGLQGAAACRAGFDTTAYWARTGGLLDAVPEGAIPPHLSQGLGDMSAGAMLAYGILSAYIGRLKTGKGTLISSSLYSCGIYYMAAGIISAQDAYHKRFPQDPLSPENPFRHQYQCADGSWIMLAVQSYNRMWPKLCRVFEMEEWKDMDDFSTEEAARKSGVVPKIVQHLNLIFQRHTLEEWAKKFISEDIAFEKLCHYRDVSHDEQAWENGYLSEVVFRGTEHIIMPNSPIQMSDYDKREIQPQGGIGKDSEAILEQLHDSVPVL